MATKETFYFSHDYNSRNDPKMVSLLMKTGVVGIGVYWCIIEMLYEQGGYIQIEECERIAFELRTENELVLKIIESNLFGRNKEMFWSESVIRRLNVRKVKSARARESANYRWNDANGMRAQSDSNAIKESKGKESKGKNGVKGKENQMPVVGIKIEDDKVFFNDGSDRILTLSEQSLISMNELKPEKITK